MNCQNAARSVLGVVGSVAIGASLLVMAPGVSSAGSPTQRVAVEASGNSSADASRIWGKISAALDVRSKWTGSVSSCVAGSNTEAFDNATVDALNGLRELAGQPPVSRSSSLSAGAMQAALISAANEDLNHYPSPSAKCATDLGIKSSAASNLHARPGATAILDYAIDPGTSNTRALHRLNMFSSVLSEVGVGNTNVWSALQVKGGVERSSNQQWIEWPSSGQFPQQLWPQQNTIFGFASGTEWTDGAPARFSLAKYEADFTAAGVSMTRDGKPVNAQVYESKKTRGDNIITWDVKGAEPNADGTPVRYDVTVSNVRLADGSTVSHSYTVTTFLPSDNGAELPIPGAPKVQVKSGKVYLSWALPKGSSRGPVKKYVVSNVFDETVCETTRTSCVISPVPADVTRYRVASSDGVSLSGWSPFSSPVGGAVPDQPLIEGTTYRGTRATVRFSPPESGNVVGYKYRIGSGKWVTAKSLSFSFSIRRGPVQWQLKAFNYAGESRVVGGVAKRPGL